MCKDQPIDVFTMYIFQSFMGFRESSSIKICTWVKNFDPPTLPGKIGNRGKLNKINVLFSVECLHGDKTLCKLEVHIIFAILARDVFRTQLNIYDEAFEKKVNC